MTLSVTASEHGLVRIFALSMTEADATVLSKQKDPALLGLTDWNADFVEIFPVRDLNDLGLAGYLEAGCGIAKDRLASDLPKLAALDGWVLLLFSSALISKPATLTPDARLTHIATYAEPGVDWTPAQTLTSAAAQGTTAPARKKASDAAMSGRIATLVLLVMFALTGLMVWIAG